MKEDLRVKIPKRFKGELEKRFDLRRARKKEEEWSIYAECPLCFCYSKMFGVCGECPLARFKDKNGSNWGCTTWVEKVLGKKPCFEIDSCEDVWWNDILDKEAREEIKKFKKRTRRLIEWV